MKAPDKIYLQVCGTCPLEGVECERCNFDGLEEVTWSTDKVFDKDVEFIRKDALLEWLQQGFDWIKNPVISVQQIIDKLNSL